jgi:hypothetical protein
MPWPSDDDTEWWSEQSAWPNDQAVPCEVRRVKKCTPKPTRRDSGGWSSTGIDCPKCHQPGGVQTIIYGRIIKSYCSICAHDWPYEEHESSEDDDRE